jgi:peptidoglycan/LPS O-acetylase OafA/YrhL
MNTALVVRFGEISYEVFLLHVIAMEIAMASVLRWPVFTGSWPVVFAITLAMTIPAAWLLHRWTRPGWTASGPAANTPQAIAGERVRA